MMLKDKVAVIYGAGGRSAAPSHTRTHDGGGANLFLTGRSLGPVELVAKDVASAGGSAEAAKVDALDEQAVDEHLQSVIDTAGRVDISFDAIGIPSTTVLYVPPDRAGYRAFLPADHDPRHAVLRDRTPGRTAHGPERIRGDHDGHHTPLAFRASLWRGAKGRRRPPRRRSRESSPPSSPLTAFASSGRRYSAHAARRGRTPTDHIILDETALAGARARSGCRHAGSQTNRSAIRGPGHRRPVERLAKHQRRSKPTR